MARPRLESLARAFSFPPRVDEVPLMARRNPRKSGGKVPGNALPPLPDLPPAVRDAMLTVQPEPALIAEAVRRILALRGKVSEFKACTDAYADFHGLGRNEMLSSVHIVGMGALVLRVTALREMLASDLLGSGEPREERFQAVLAATSTVRLLDSKRAPAFHPLEFLAAVERIEADLRR
jgi:hypothetical protein